MSNLGDTKTVTAKTQDELDKKVSSEIIAQGWQADGPVIINDDGTLSQNLKK